MNHGFIRGNSAPVISKHGRLRRTQKPERKGIERSAISLGGNAIPVALGGYAEWPRIVGGAHSRVSSSSADSARDGPGRPRDCSPRSASGFSSNSLLVSIRGPRARFLAEGLRGQFRELPRRDLEPGPAPGRAPGGVPGRGASKAGGGSSPRGSGEWPRGVQREASGAPGSDIWPGLISCFLARATRERASLSFRVGRAAGQPWRRPACPSSVASRTMRTLYLASRRPRASAAPQPPANSQPTPTSNSNELERCATTK
ncbi:hypothetical protein KM043_003326 [Ampulex compressa]|nr:hypothetical protein KM043_003326 [Ampulex compressa]